MYILQSRELNGPNNHKLFHEDSYQNIFDVRVSVYQVTSRVARVTSHFRAIFKCDYPSNCLIHGHANAIMHWAHVERAMLAQRLLDNVGPMQ